MDERRIYQNEKRLSRIRLQEIQYLYNNEDNLDIYDSETVQDSGDSE